MSRSTGRGWVGRGWLGRGWLQWTTAVLAIACILATLGFLMTRPSDASDSAALPAPSGSLVPRPDPNAPRPSLAASTAPSASPAHDLTDLVAPTAPASRKPAARPSPKPATRTTPPVSSPEAVPSSSLNGQDVSWPQCPKGVGQGKGMRYPDEVTAGLTFSVIGVNDGKPFSTNPCLAEQVARARALGQWLGVYVMPGLPLADELDLLGGVGPFPATTRSGRLRNTAYLEASYTVDALRSAGLNVPLVWLDVEEMGHDRAWRHNAAGQQDARDVIAGMQAGFAAAGINSGFYSYTYGWKQITGGLRSDAPIWYTVAHDGWDGAVKGCSKASWSGGPIVLSQWYTGSLDYDITCPALDSTGGMERYFIR